MNRLWEVRKETAVFSDFRERYLMERHSATLSPTPYERFLPQRPRSDHFAHIPQHTYVIRYRCPDDCRGSQEDD